MRDQTFGLYLTVFLALASPSAAEWTEIYDDENTTEEIDKSTITLSGNTRSLSGGIDSPDNRVTMRSMVSYAKAQDPMEENYLSEENLIEYDCKDRRMRLLHHKTYSKPWGEGELVGDYDVKDAGLSWVPIPPKSIAMKYSDVACSSFTLYSEIERIYPPQWDQVATSTLDAYYIDQSMIRRRSENIVRALVLVDLLVPLIASDGQSIVSEEEFDCANKFVPKMRTTYKALYTGRMASGVGDDSQTGPLTRGLTEWRNIKPGSGLAIVWNFVCSHPIPPRR